MASNNSYPDSSKLETSNPDEDLNRIYVTCQDSSEVIRKTLEFRKTSQKHLSLEFICRKSGIPSRGYLSAVTKGKRLLNQKYRDSLCEAFRLEGLRADFFKTFIDHDHARPEVQPFLMMRLSQLRKYLGTDLHPMAKEVSLHFLTHLVAGAMGLFEHRATLKQISGVLSKYDPTSIQVAIDNLIKWGLMRKEGDQYSYSESEQVVYQGAKDDRSQVALFRESMESALELMEGPWFEMQDKVAVFTEAFAVREDVYLANIERIRKMLANFRDEFHGGKGNTLILFNVQLGPVFSPRALKNQEGGS